MGTIAAQLTDVSLTLRDEGRETKVFQNLNLTVEQKEILTIVGASGTGKTTLLHVLAGLRQVDSGTLDLSASINQIGIVFQQPHLFPWLNVRQNIELGLRFKSAGHIGRRERKEQVQSLIKVLGLTELENQSVSGLSGGQAQRVAIARTLAIHPNLVLLDEPFGALDAGTRHDLQDWLKQLRDRLNLTIVLVTHDLDEAFYLGDRVALLANDDQSLEIYSSEALERNSLRNSQAHQEILSKLKSSKDNT